MSRVWFSGDLETVATYWRLLRCDGVTLGFVTHDANLWFDGVLHVAAPGMMPAAIRRSSGFDDDSAEVDGAIVDDAITSDDLVCGRYDNATVVVGLVDWQTLEYQPIYSGRIGNVTEQADSFTAQLQSRKADLKLDPIPRTSPSCRANFCGLGCTLSAPRFTHEAVLVSIDPTTNAVTLTCDAAPALLVGGTLRWMDGPYAGLAMGIMSLGTAGLVIDSPLDFTLTSGMRAQVLEGCDHTLQTCSTRFGNAINFQGEPFLPGNDLIVRYGLSSE